VEEQAEGISFLEGDLAIRMRKSVLYTMLAVATVVGMAACKEDISFLPLTVNRFAAVGRGANVIPLPTAADTLPEATAALTSNDDSTFTYSYTVVSPPCISILS
jgi:hypothetical protein